MPLFVVSYDLRKRKDYEALWEEMERLGGHKPLQSVYFLNVDAPNAAALRDHLAAFIDEDDQLIVVEFTKKPAHQMAKKRHKRLDQEQRLILPFAKHGVPVTQPI